MKNRLTALIAASVGAATATSTVLLTSRVGAQQKRPAAEGPNHECQVRLKQVALGMMMYVQDYDERFPPMQTAKQVQNRLRPYVKREAVFYCPVTRQPYQPIKAMGGKSLAGVSDPAKTPMLFDSRRHPDGTENTAYADGRVLAGKGSPAARKRIGH